MHDAPLGIAARASGPALPVPGLDRRAAAVLIDSFIVAVLIGLASWVFGVDHVINGTAPRPGQSGPHFYQSTSAIDPVPAAAIAIAYFVILEGLFGNTIGKLLLRLRVTNLERNPASVGAILVRNLLRPVDWAPGVYLVAWIVAATSPLRQRLGDRIARTIVVDAATAPAAVPTQVRARVGGLLTVVVLLVAGSLAFLYWGRPPLVIEGLYNTGQLPGPGAYSHAADLVPPSGTVVAYTIGNPTWGAGEVTYPIYYQTRRRVCSGTITLHWNGFLAGWSGFGGQAGC